MFFVTDINEDNLNWLFQVLLLHILQIVAIAVLLLAVSVFSLVISYHDDYDDHDYNDDDNYDYQYFYDDDYDDDEMMR